MRTTSGARKVLRSVEKSLGVQRTGSYFSKTTANRLANKTLDSKVSSLSRQVKKLNMISYDKITCEMAQVVDSSVVLPYFAYHVNQRMDLWTPIFGSNNSDTTNADKIYVNSYKTDMRLSQGNEADRIYYSVFLVSLKDDANDATTFDPATGALSLGNGTHYKTLGANGKVLLNQKFFTIHSYKRFTMGGRPGDQSAPETRDLSFTIVPKQKMIVNPKGNVLNNATFTHPKDPSQNYYFLLFNDDAALDAQVNTINIGGLASIAVPQ